MAPSCSCRQASCSFFFSGACVASLVPSSRLTLPDHPPPPFNYPRPTTPPHDDHSPGLPASKNERACMGRERVRCKSNSKSSPKIFP
jgi:hypothetical protein